MEHLALTYKCHSSIGNSLDLKNMLKEVLETFVMETDALNGFFYLIDEESRLYKYLAYKEDDNFDANSYSEFISSYFISDDFTNKEQKVLILPLNKGIFFLVYKNDIDFDFIGSMFQDLVVKLNISIDSCLNMKLIKNRNKTLDHLAQELKKQQQELLEADKYKSNFLANMSHELKTPLNSIIVISSIMSKNKKLKLDDEQVKNMKIINNCGNDLLILINDVLDITKIEAGEIAINLGKVNINELLSELIAEMKPLGDEKGLGLELSSAIEDVTLLTDAHRIKQIVKNLLSNSIKFTHDGNISIILEENANDITIKVIDKGIGISADKLSHIFDRFKQADGSTTRKYGGTGLGLAISQELASLLGGDIKAFSEVNEGSTFELILPKKTNIKNISDDNVSISSKDEEVEIEEIVLFDMGDIDIEEEIENQHKGTILVVNSDYTSIFQAAIALKKQDILIEHAEGISKANQKLTSGDYSMTIIDKDNSKEDIEPFLKLCNEKNKGVIILSSEDSENSNYLKKELINGQLINLILDHLGNNHGKI